MKKWDNTFKRPFDRFWVCFTHPDHKEADGKYIPQGYAKISVEIMPKKFADDNANGLGRDAPNQYPFLPKPMGRFMFVSHLFSNRSRTSSSLGKW